MAILLVLSVAKPVGSYVPSVSNGQKVHVGCISEYVAYLERSGLLTLDPEWVDAVDYLEVVSKSELSN